MPYYGEEENRTEMHNRGGGRQPTAKHKTTHTGKTKKTNHFNPQEHAENPKPIHEQNQQQGEPRNTPPRQAQTAEAQDLHEPDTLARLIDQIMDTTEEAEGAEKTQSTAVNKEKNRNENKIQEPR